MKLINHLKDTEYEFKGIKEVRENIKKSPNKLKVKNALSGEFAHVSFE